MQNSVETAIRNTVEENLFSGDQLYGDEIHRGRGALEAPNNHFLHIVKANEFADKMVEDIVWHIPKGT